jgi:hypothetical protein
MTTPRRPARSRVTWNAVSLLSGKRDATAAKAAAAGER